MVPKSPMTVTRLLTWEARMSKAAAEDADPEEVTPIKPRFLLGARFEVARCTHVKRRQGDGLNRQGIFVGCAGWSVGGEHAASFPNQGTHLQRYASHFNCVEINSSFYRPHRRQTYTRWAESVPEAFRFSVKVPKRITHQLRLTNCERPLEEFIGQCTGLGEHLGCLLVQLPPSMAFDVTVAEGFFRILKEQYSGPVIVEPRHESWADATSLLMTRQVSQAAVDPSRLSTDASPGGALGVQYWRLHGSPRIYYSAYGRSFLEGFASQLQAAAAEGATVWCIFDNTASGAALRNALDLSALLTQKADRVVSPPPGRMSHEPLGNR